MMSIVTDVKGGIFTYRLSIKLWNGKIVLKNFYFILEL